MIKKRRLVALFDILGFGQRLQTDSLTKVQRELRRLIRQIRSKSATESATNDKDGDDDNLEHVRFAFDSVVLVSLDTAEGRNVHKFIFACVALLELGFKHSFPLRGSITLSDVFVDEETGLLLGDQFPQLRDGEAMQEWTGCFVHPPAEEMIYREITGSVPIEEKKLNPDGCDPLIWSEVPLKPAFASRSPMHAWCVNWGYFLSASQIERGLAFMAPVLSKRQHTERFLARIHGLTSDAQLLEGPVPPGTYIKTLRSRYGMVVRFVDKAGNPVPMPAATLRYTVSGKADSKVIETQQVDTRAMRQSDDA